MRPETVQLETVLLMQKLFSWHRWFKGDLILARSNSCTLMRNRNNYLWPFFFATFGIQGLFYPLKSEIRIRGSKPKDFVIIYENA